MDFIIFAFVVFVGYILIALAVVVGAMFWYVSLPLLLVGATFWCNRKKANNQNEDAEYLNMRKKEEAWQKEVERALQRARGKYGGREYHLNGYGIIKLV